jgi:hypothetical protein
MQDWPWVALPFLWLTWSRKPDCPLQSHLADRGFCSDMNQLLRVGAEYDPQKAGAYVKARLLSLLPK